MQHPSERSVDEILKAIQKVIEKDPNGPSRAATNGADESGVMLRGAPHDAQADNDIEFLVSKADERADTGILDLGAAATALDEEGESEGESAQSDAAPSHAPDSDANAAAQPGSAPDRIIARIEDTLTSDHAAAAMRRSLSDLSRVSEEPRSAPAPDGETTIEQLVRDMLRPMLAQWLDAHLPPMVERLVKDEITRIAGKRS